MVVWSYVPLARSRGKGKEKNKWAEELKSDPVLCKCGIEATCVLVPSELGVSYFCGHIVDYDEVGIPFCLHQLQCCTCTYCLLSRRRGNAVGRDTSRKKR
jgi:hypothetical protein